MCLRIVNALWIRLVLNMGHGPAENRCMAVMSRLSGKSIRVRGILIVIVLFKIQML
ncbi:hypothetical protein D3C75_1144080 [compost metagenome]